MKVKHGKETTPPPPILNSAVMEGVPKEATLYLVPVRTEGAIQLSGRRVPQAAGTAMGKVGHRQDSASVPPTRKGTGAGRCLHRQTGRVGQPQRHPNAQGF